VRQIQFPPLRVVETGLLRVGDIAKLKAPILIEGNFFTGTRIGETDSRDEEKKTKGDNDVQCFHGIRI
jgi:hypothetical protein